MNKHGWTYKKLGEVTSSISGLWTGKKPPFVEVAVIRNTNFTKDCRLDMSDVAYLQVEEKQYKTRKLIPGDIIIEKSGGSEKQPVGRPVLFDIPDGEYSFSNFTATLRLTTDSLCPSFLQKFLYAKYCQGFTLRLQPKTTGIHNLDFRSYLKLQIPIPSVAEQEAIVAELDEINEAIAMLKQQVDDLDALAQSTFYTMFGDPVTNPKGWEVKKLGELAMVKTGPFGSMLHKEDYITNGIPLVNPIHMKNYTVVPDMDFTVSERKAAELSNYLLQENDVVFARRGDIGRCAVINKKQNGFLCGTGSLFVRFAENVNAVFIMYVIRSESFTSALISAAKGATMLNINSSVVEGLHIILPPLALQQDFSARVEAIETSKAEINAQIAEMQTLLASRMDYYFD